MMISAAIRDEYDKGDDRPTCRHCFGRGYIGDFHEEFPCGCQEDDETDDDETADEEVVE